ncbi:hypothetical protein RB195_004260 [Necator americanus]|uniref:Uncharacterized protein n=1 Tax=Necator americanus TaxID=51031 RepID=A0ABR1BL93_NECAM
MQPRIRNAFEPSDRSIMVGADSETGSPAAPEDDEKEKKEEKDDEKDEEEHEDSLYDEEQAEPVLNKFF